MFLTKALFFPEFPLQNQPKTSTTSLFLWQNKEIPFFSTVFIKRCDYAKCKHSKSTAPCGICLYFSHSFAYNYIDYQTHTNKTLISEDDDAYSPAN